MANCIHTKRWTHVASKNYRIGHRSVSILETEAQRNLLDREKIEASKQTKPET